MSFLCLGPSCFMEFEPIAWRSANLVFVVLKLTCLGVSLKKSCLVYGGLLLFMVLAPFSLMWLVYLPLSVFVLIFGFFPEGAVTSSYLAVRKARFYLLLFLWSALLVGFLWEWPGVYYAARVSLLVLYGASLFLTLIVGCSADRWTPQGTLIESFSSRLHPVRDAVVNYNFFFWPLLVARLGYPPRSMDGVYPWCYDRFGWRARFRVH